MRLLQVGATAARAAGAVFSKTAFKTFTNLLISIEDTLFRIHVEKSIVNVLKMLVVI